MRKAYILAYHLTLWTRYVKAPHCLACGRLGMIYKWHDLSASGVLAVLAVFVLAIRCIACALCGSGLDHVARASGHVCGKYCFTRV